MPDPVDHLLAALELAEEGERGEDGLLTEDARAAVQAALDAFNGSASESPPPASPGADPQP
jgi:hypothetical protein